MKCRDRTPFWKMAATDDTSQIQLGTIAKLPCIGVLYEHAKFHAFTTKCTIFSLSAVLKANNRGKKTKKSSSYISASQATPKDEAPKKKERTSSAASSRHQWKRARF